MTRFGAELATLRDVEHELERFRQRVLVAALFTLLLLLLLALRLTYLQVWQYQDLLARAEANRTAVVPVVPKRGEIRDRNGVVLATNYTSYALQVTPSLVSDMQATLAEVGKLVELSPRTLRRFEQLRKESRAADAITLRNQLSEEEVARFAAQQYRFAGVELAAGLFRVYPLGASASHLVGYIGRVSPRDKAAMQNWDEERQANYRGTDYIGKRGIEEYYEQALHGQSGFAQVETSASGHAVRTLARTPAQAGQNLQLTIDIKLQQLVERLYGGRRGALVAMDPRSGELVALVSMPVFDPNLFVEGIDTESWRTLNESLDTPLLNRAIRGTYPPGSTYKPFMALLALNNGVRQASTVVQDPGYWTFGGHVFRSHGDGGLGPVNLRTSIVKSSNVYYYTLANEVGVDAIHDFMQRLGFGQRTGIDLRGELSGVLPSQAWKRRHFGKPEQQRWYAGETISLGIGQGYNTFTPLQLAAATAVLVNGGVRVQPHLLRRDSDAPPNTGTPLGYASESLALVREAMVGVTQEGTSRGVFAGAGYSSGGKTGTAQAVTIAQDDRYDADKLDERQRDHSLYIGFAPAEAPRLVVAAIVENAGFGSAAAAPIVRRVMDYWLLGQYPSEEDIAAVQQGEGRAPRGAARVVSDVKLQPLPGFVEMTAANRMATPVPPMATAPGN
ncbi:MAG: penicillin-binding protein 2 [Burkholderiaceae bacterium]